MKMRKYMRPEKKYHDLNLGDDTLTAGGQAITTNGVHTNSSTLVGIPQGITENTRIGRKCTITDIYLRLNIEFTGTGTSSLAAATTCHETVRIMLFWDKQCNGTFTTAVSILETDHYNSFRNLANVGRYVILYNKTFVWNADAIGAGNGTSNDSQQVIKDYQVRITKKVFIPIEYLLTTGALTSNISTNNIGLFIWTKHGSRMSLTDGSRMRIRYIDY